MFRALVYAIITIFAITFVRLVTQLLFKNVGDMFKEEASSNSPPRPSATPPATPTSGELKPCKTCGTYVLTSSALQLPDKSGVSYFCSKACKEKAAAAS